MNDRITIDPSICHGKPVIRGTRTPVSIVIGSLAGGMSFEEVQREYDLTNEDIRAALKFAGEFLDQYSVNADDAHRGASDSANHGSTKIHLT